MNDRVIINPNFKNNGEFHRSLAAKGVGAKDWPNTHTEVDYLGNGRFAASLSVGHRVFFDKADNSKPKKHKLTDERPGKDYVLIQSAKCCVEVYPYYAKYFDVQHEEVKLYEERWVVQRLFKEPDEWRGVDAYNPVITVEEYPEPAGDVVKVTVTYDTDYGILTVEYFQRDGNALKHNVTFKNTSGSTETFRVLQRWAGIVADRVNKGEITGLKETLAYGFHFEKNEKVCINENLNSFIPTWQDECEAAKKMWVRHGECNRCGKCCLGCPEYIEEYPRCKIYETRPDYCKEFPWSPEQIENIPEYPYTFEETGVVATPGKLQPVILDIHPQGLKADFIYADWILAQNESLEIDPDDVTLDNPTEDGYLRRQADTQEGCPTGDLTRNNDGPTFVYGGSRSPDWSGAERAYVEWPIAALFGGTLSANPIFKYSTPSWPATEATDDQINPLTEGAPSGASDANLWTYCGSGVAYVDPFAPVESTDNQSQDLGATAKSDLQDAIDIEQSWFAIGFTSPDDECYPPGGAKGTYWDHAINSEEKTDAANPKPTLYVEYTPAPPPPVAAKHTPHCGPRRKRVDFFPTLGM